MKRVLISSIAIAALSTAAFAQGNPPCPAAPQPVVNCTNNGASGRQINITGATLLRGLFERLAHVNDFVDVNNDGCCGFDPSPVLPQCVPGPVYTLGPANRTGYWIVQSRAVGSVNGLTEFVRYNICNDIPDFLCTDRSYINTVQFADGTGPLLSGATDDVDQDGCQHGINRANNTPNANGTGTPVVPCSMDIAILDVPPFWGIQGPTGSGNWNRQPGDAGYGIYYKNSVALPGGCAVPGPVLPALATLSSNCGSRQLTLDPGTADSVYSTSFTSAPIVPIANRGTGISQLKATDLQYMHVTGRDPIGLNWAVGTRDAGSGTRNGFANSLGIDPAWANGDNRGTETDSSSRTNLGPCHRMTNCGSSSHLQNGVQQRRIGIAYTGIGGSSAAAQEAAIGRYEIVDVMNNHVGGTQYVRATVNSIVRNSNVNTGWRISGPATFATVGNPFISSPAADSSRSHPCVCSGTSAFSYNASAVDKMVNPNAADYLYNFLESVRCFSANPAAVDNQLMPGQFLAKTFFLFDSQDAVQDLVDPTVFNLAPSHTGSSLQTYVLQNNNFDAPALVADPINSIVTKPYGSVNEAGLVPNRSQGSYRYLNNAGAETTIAAGVRLSIRNRIAFDFAYSGANDVNDIAPAVAALVAGRNGSGTPLFTDGVLPTPGGTSDDPALTNNDNNGNNTIIVDLIGDLNGDGVFDAEDLRYEADGFIVTNGKLNRCTGFNAVDAAYTGGLAGRPAGNFFNTSIVRPNGAATAYIAGASRFDVTGAAAGAAKGDNPIGANGTVDIADYAYVAANQGNWANLDEAALIDLSADMNGDLVVDGKDLVAFWTCAWGTVAGDLNFDGSVGLTDLSILLANFGTTVQPTDVLLGNLNGDTTVGLTDLSILLANFGVSYSPSMCSCN